ncbi:hypothetical protein L2W58_09650 [Dethiosulfovibrio sp. F2B]|uniref:hypothetical protein n=1 Tax=Dethiosulfovibrio faecalis TaxID=2720018 RepID=UPI001F3C4BF9|nr:hypothetical protein [Dethiosulfovibrio faecalis]MCF4152061.1 hypothetical protein [Dethiosulfovibrio faecalis]
MKHTISSKITCAFFLLALIFLSRAEADPNVNVTTWDLTETDNVIQFKFNGSQYKEIPLGEHRPAWDKSASNIKSQYPKPNYFTTWPSMKNIEEQVYWYHRPTDMLYIAVASMAIKKLPPSELDPNDIPYHYGIRGEYNLSPINVAEQFRHSAFLSMKKVNNGTCWPILIIGEGANAKTIYGYMGNSGSPHVGYIHFFPLWQVSALNPNKLPEGTFTAKDISGVTMSQKIKFGNTIFARELKYYP